jgi:hypothetical protein
VRRRRPPQPLFRGDDAKAVASPDPSSNRAIVSHILYLDGIGRPTPFTSTSDSRDSAAHFAGPRGRVWETDAPKAIGLGARHLAKKDLLHLLKGYGKGRARWNNALEVAQARAYVLRWSEHLIDWKGHASIASAIAEAFK